MKKYILASILPASLLLADTLDSDLEDILNMQSELSAEVGSRSGSVGTSSSIVPTDVITHEQIKHSGYTNLSDALRYFVSGYNSPKTSIADGSDHIRIFTLRGMSPDQVLVLVNGKRIHTSALLNVNATIGRGSSGVDLDTIPLVAVEKIEILRDGAAAQYGSDAISGVVNIILKGYGFDSEASLHTGIRDKKDGEKVSASAFVSLPQRYDGYTNLTIEASQQQKTQRARKGAYLYPSHAGLPKAKDLKLLLNNETNLENDASIYSNIIFNYRDSEASAFFRPADHNPATTLLYPDGFLPMINAKINDASFTLGIKDKTSSGLNWDLSNTLGYNEIRYYLTNSMNYGYGATSPRSFNLGVLRFLQNSTNLDLKQSFGLFELAGGVEFRYENYEIKSGDEASYTNGISQGFAGYHPDNAQDKSRKNYALYLDALYKPSSDFTLDIATRYEHYNDFGSTLNAKLALGYKASQNLLLRASASTGFRAPSLAQSYYSQTSTFGGLVEGTFRVDDEISRALGSKDLKAEKSRHFTIGAIYSPTSKTSLSIDYFHTKVNDRIMLSNEIGGAGATPAQNAILLAHGVDKARFFTNAVDTHTQGVDLKLTHKEEFANSSSLDSTIWYNYSKNEVISFNNPTQNRANSFEQVDRMEHGQPKEALRILNSYNIDKTTITLNVSRYGKYAQVIEGKQYDFNSKWLCDVDISYAFSKSLDLFVGAHNLFDTYPNEWSGVINNNYGSTGVKPYSRYSPFGYSGAYYYASLAYRF